MQHAHLYRVNHPPRRDNTPPGAVSTIPSEPNKSVEAEHLDGAVQENTSHQNHCHKPQPSQGEGTPTEMELV